MTTINYHEAIHLFQEILSHMEEDDKAEILHDMHCMYERSENKRAISLKRMEDYVKLQLQLQQMAKEVQLGEILKEVQLGEILIPHPNKEFIEKEEFQL